MITKLSKQEVFALMNKELSEYDNLAQCGANIGNVDMPYFIHCKCNQSWMSDADNIERFIGLFKQHKCLKK